jgi:hypothetical protein
MALLSGFVMACSANDAYVCNTSCKNAAGEIKETSKTHSIIGTSQEDAEKECNKIYANECTTEPYTIYDSCACELPH